MRDNLAREHRTTLRHYFLAAQGSGLSLSHNPYSSIQLSQQLGSEMEAIWVSAPLQQWGIREKKNDGPAKEKKKKKKRTKKKQAK